jgi:thymidylate synthase (FAD)
MINVVLKHHCGSDLSVVNSARVSFDKESSSLSDKDEKLIHYLAKHKHTSPFGHAFVTFKVDAPVFVARQLVKHKFLRWNEVSRRYVDNEPDIYSPDHWRQRPENKKQGSGEAFEKEHQQFMQQQYVEIMDRVLKMYEYMLAYGVAPEQARMMLPQSMMTSWWWSGSLDAFADMCKLRLGPDSQTETREVAIQIAEEMVNLFPVSWKALMEND